ncbi:MAG TPA: carbon-phosphorus lyase complex subunit PhnI [Candidatus Dormibacteraeota bacterium]
MGYTTVRDRDGAVAAAARLAASRHDAGGGDWGERLPLLVDQVMAEAGVYEPRVAALAMDQAAGDVARACSLIRAWSAVLPRLGCVTADAAELRVERRITPGFAEPAGGQYLGASLDYAQRLLDLGSGGEDAPPEVEPDGEAPRDLPAAFPPARRGLDREGLLAPPEPRAEPVDLVREQGDRTRRGALLALLARADTGAATALAYSAVRGFAALQDPTVVELRSGHLPVTVPHPDGGQVEVGEVPATVVELVLYRMHGGVPDARLTLGVGATPGRLERRAIAAALLDATTTRAAADPPARLAPCEDAEFLSIVLDAQEAVGFVEHLKLPHHVTFTSDLDRIRSARR